MFFCWIIYQKWEPELWKMFSRSRTKVHAASFTQVYIDFTERVAEQNKNITFLLKTTLVKKKNIFSTSKQFTSNLVLFGFIEDFHLKAQYVFILKLLNFKRNCLVLGTIKLFLEKVCQIKQTVRFRVLSGISVKTWKSHLVTVFCKGFTDNCVLCSLNLNGSRLP